MTDRRFCLGGSATSATHPGGDEQVLVVGAGDSAELVEQVCVAADEHARLPGERAVEDDLRRFVGSGAGHRFVEELHQFGLLADPIRSSQGILAIITAGSIQRGQL